MASVTPSLASAREEPFFLVGSERSGTTLLRLMLAHHPEIECTPEFEFMVEALPAQGWPALEPYYDWLATNRIFLPHGLSIDRTLIGKLCLKHLAGCTGFMNEAQRFARAAFVRTIVDRHARSTSRQLQSRLASNSFGGTGD